MADLVSGDSSSPPADAPAYEITSGDDGVLRWKPPIGSIELALSLSYHFPRQETLEDKMKAAILRYIRASKKHAAQQSSSGSLSEGQTKFKVAPPQLQMIAGESLCTQPPLASYDNEESSYWASRRGDTQMMRELQLFETEVRHVMIIDGQRDSAVTCTQNKQHEQYGLEHIKNVSEVTSGSTFGGNIGIYKNDSGVSSSQNGVVLDPSDEFLRQSTDQDEQLGQGRVPWSSLQAFASSDTLPCSASQQLDPLQLSVDNFPSDMASEALDDTDTTWYFSTVPDLDWDEHKYFNAYPTSYVETSFAVMGEVRLQTGHEAPGPDLILQRAESSTSNSLTPLLHALPKGELPAVVGQDVNKEVGGLAHDPIDVPNMPETVALPQLEYSGAVKSYSYGGGYSGSGWKASKSSRHYCCKTPRARTKSNQSPEKYESRSTPSVCRKCDNMPELALMIESISIRDSNAQRDKPRRKWGSDKRRYECSCW